MKGVWLPYSTAEEAWLREHGALPARELHAAFCLRFGRADITRANLVAKRKRMGISTGRTGRFVPGLTPHNKGKPYQPGGRSAETRFRKGNLPHNTNYLGHERTTKDGYVEISVDERDPYTGFERRYVLKHRWLWERMHGPLPPGMALKSGDGNRANCDPANWHLVQRSMLPRLNGGRAKTRIAYDAAPDALKPTIMAVAQVEDAVHRARRAGSSSATRGRHETSAVPHGARQPGEGRPGPTGPQGRMAAAPGGACPPGEGQEGFGGSCSPKGDSPRGVA